MINLLPEERTTIETYDMVADIWSGVYSQPGFWTNEMRRFQELLPSGTILEIGAGAGEDAVELISYGFGYVGTDISEKLLQSARRKLPAQKFYALSVYDLDFEQKFNGFWASRVLLHLPKSRIDQALQSIKRAVEPGAIGFISLIDGSGEGMELEPWDDGSQHQRYFAYYSKAEFSAVLRKNGFKLADYSYRKDSDRFKWHCFFVQA
jgi:ubiquinone/menaquinone biosynthesis C-methylase UbiE